MATEEEMRQAKNEFEFTNEMAHCRDLLKPIIEGEIERGRSLGTIESIPSHPGKRKIKLKDTREIAKTIFFRINRALNAFAANEDI